MQNNIVRYLLLFVLFNCCLKMEALTQNIDCKVTKYPIILVHGIGYRDNIKIKKYWSNIPEKMKESGYNVFLSNTDAITTHESNAKLLRSRIFDVLNTTNAQKVNLIAYSKGGIEARYTISKLGMADKVASLTTIATPHRGTVLADMALNIIDKLNIIELVDNSGRFYAKIIGDSNPLPLDAYKQLTTTFMEEFNKEVSDMPQVYYQSYSAKITETYPKMYSRLKYKLIFKKAGENDGVVPLNSTLWGDYKGVIEYDENIGLSHFEVIGFSKATDFEPSSFFIKIANDLAAKGF